jgi:hypothetical protein
MFPVPEAEAMQQELAGISISTLLKARGVGSLSFLSPA